MAEIPSRMAPLGSAMPNFDLPNIDGTKFSSTSLDEKPVLVIFICNHCPFVKHLIDVLVEKVRTYQQQGAAVVAINSNDVVKHPDDNPDKMKIFAEEHGITFPYLFDESQDAARLFKAACTPDFFLYDRNHKLAYRGQFDDSRPSLGKQVSGADLSAAVEAVAKGQAAPGNQKPSIGCNIKWK